MAEIEERRAWLEEMTALGQGARYRDQIRAEIAVRVKRLESLK
jgi:hypothetical protein